MELCLLKRLDNAKRDPVLMRLQHDPLAFGQPEPEDAHEGPDHVVHGVAVVVVEQDPVPGYMRTVLFQNSAWFGGRERGHFAGKKRRHVLHPGHDGLYGVASLPGRA
jgi:hypothetical protein